MLAALATVKIGVFLNATPSDGGAFQYSRSILEAVASLPEEKFETLAAYTNPAWIDPLSGQNIPALALHPGIWGFLARKRISSRIPVSLWRQMSLYFHPLIRTMNQHACSLWIFPAQDTWTYLCPFPALGTVHDLMHRYEKRFPEVSAKGIYESRERHYKNLCRWSKGVLVDSSMGGQQLIESYQISSDKIFSMPFVAARRVAPDRDETTRISRLYNLPEKFFFYPAQFWEHKNHQGLIAAMATLRDRLPDVKIVLSGAKKSGYEVVRKRVLDQALADRVIFLGFIPDAHMPCIYRQARALIMPTFFGPTNIPPLEAMACGCPTAVSNIYAMREQLGNAALYFHPASIGDMTAIMEQLWQDDVLCRDLSQRGLQHHASWNHNQFNVRLQEILESLIEKEDI